MYIWFLIKLLKYFITLFFWFISNKDIIVLHTLKKGGKTKNKDTTDSLNIFSGILIHKLVRIPSHRQELFNHKQFTVPLFSKTFTIIQYTSPLTFNDVFQTGTRHQQRPTGCGPPNMFFHEKGAFQDGLVSWVKEMERRGKVKRLL